MIDFLVSSVSSASTDGSASTTLQVCRGPSSGHVGLRWFRLGGGRFLLRLQEYQSRRFRLQVALLCLDYQELDLVAVSSRERLCDQPCYLLMMETYLNKTQTNVRLLSFLSFHDCSWVNEKRKIWKMKLPSTLWPSTSRISWPTSRPPASYAAPLSCENVN